MTERDRPPVTVVWCDFGGVLTPALGNAMREVSAASGVEWDDLWGAADAVARRLGLSGLQPLELGRLSQHEWGQRVSAALPAGVVSAVDLGLWGDYWYHDRPVNSELIAELVRVSEAGVRIGMLTNSVLEWEPHRDRMLAGVTVFEEHVRSHEIDLAKPDPRIFDHADGLLPAGAGRAVLIDDLAANCAAAEAHGWLGLHHLDTGSTIARLRELVG
jgi:putative hydrolase of the HAD superfamily